MPTELEIINYETMQVKVYSKLCKHLLQYKTKPHCHVKKKKKKEYIYTELFRYVCLSDRNSCIRLDLILSNNGDVEVQTSSYTAQVSNEHMNYVIIQSVLTIN